MKHINNKQESKFANDKNVISEEQQPTRRPIRRHVMIGPFG